jgi:GST-like protein
VFLRYAPERIPYAIDRYQREVRRLFEVLERQLSHHEYVAGEQYSIADIAHWAWIHGYGWSGVSIEGLPHLARWIERIAARPAVKRGRAVPPPGDVGDKDKATVEAGRKMLV